MGEALFDRRSEILTLPPITVEEGIALIEGLMREWSIDRARAPFPFEPPSIEAAVRRVAGQTGVLSPRDVLRAFDGILAQAEFDLEEGAIKSIDATYALEKLSEAPDDAGAK
jgi:hypothetical protein